MSSRVSRRGVLGSLLAALLAPLAGRLRTARAGQERGGGFPPPADDDAGHAVGSFSYDDGERGMDQSLSVTNYTYDRCGRLVSVNNKIGCTTNVFRYDG
jgi:hypothetical protein